jgi:hypothetical protein
MEFENFAKENCHRVIVDYIKAYPEKLYQNPTENTKAYADLVLEILE